MEKDYIDFDSPEFLEALGNSEMSDNETDQKQKKRKRTLAPKSPKAPKPKTERGSKPAPGKNRLYNHWTPEEDTALLDGYHLHGDRWSEVATYMTKNGHPRTTASVLQRWIVKHDPTINRTPMPEDEIALMLQIIDEIGFKWSEVVVRLGTNRASYAIKNKFRSIVSTGKLKSYMYELRQARPTGALQEDGTLVGLPMITTTHARSQSKPRPKRAHRPAGESDGDGRDSDSNDDSESNSLDESDDVQLRPELFHAFGLDLPDDFPVDSMNVEPPAPTTEQSGSDIVVAATTTAAPKIRVVFPTNKSNKSGDAIISPSESSESESANLSDEGPSGGDEERSGVEMPGSREEGSLSDTGRKRDTQRNEAANGNADTTNRDEEGGLAPSPKRSKLDETVSKLTEAAALASSSYDATPAAQSPSHDANQLVDELMASLREAHTKISDLLQENRKLKAQVTNLNEEVTMLEHVVSQREVEKQEATLALEQAIQILTVRKAALGTTASRKLSGMR